MVELLNLRFATVNQYKFFPGEICCLCGKEMKDWHFMACGAAAGIRTQRHDRFLREILAKLPKDIHPMRVCAKNRNLIINQQLQPDI